MYLPSRLGPSGQDEFMFGQPPQPQQQQSPPQQQPRMQARIPFMQQEQQHLLMLMQQQQQQQQQPPLLQPQHTPVTTTGPMASHPLLLQQQQPPHAHHAHAHAHLHQQQQQHSSPGSLDDGTQQDQQQFTSQEKFKTELCRKFALTGYCRYADMCQFAHGSHELRALVRHPLYKTSLCKSFEATGTCRYGTRCRFIHDENSEQLAHVARGVPAINLAVSPPSWEEATAAMEDAVQHTGPVAGAIILSPPMAAVASPGMAPLGASPGFALEVQQQRPTPSSSTTMGNRKGSGVLVNANNHSNSTATTPRHNNSNAMDKQQHGEQRVLSLSSRTLTQPNMAASSISSSMLSSPASSQQKIQHQQSPFGSGSSTRHDEQNGGSASISASASAPMLRSVSSVIMPGLQQQQQQQQQHQHQHHHHQMVTSPSASSLRGAGGGASERTSGSGMGGRTTSVTVGFDDTLAPPADLDARRLPVANQSFASLSDVHHAANSPNLGMPSSTGPSASTATTVSPSSALRHSYSQPQLGGGLFPSASSSSLSHAPAPTSASAANLASLSVIPPTSPMHRAAATATDSAVPPRSASGGATTTSQNFKKAASFANHIWFEATSDEHDWGGGASNMARAKSVEGRLDIFRNLSDQDLAKLDAIQLANEAGREEGGGVTPTSKFASLRNFSEPNFAAHAGTTSSGGSKPSSPSHVHHHQQQQQQPRQSTPQHYQQGGSAFFGATQHATPPPPSLLFTQTQQQPPLPPQQRVPTHAPLPPPQPSTMVFGKSARLPSFERLSELGGQGVSGDDRETVAEDHDDTEEEEEGFSFGKDLN